MSTHKRFSSANVNKESAPVSRRTALAQLSALAAVAGWPQQTEAAASPPDVNTPPPAEKRVRRIATEEAFMIPEVAAAVRDMARRIAAILLREPELDANYRAVAGAVYLASTD